jgi:hypothetical protein
VQLVLIVPLLTFIQTKEQYNTHMKATLEFDLENPDDQERFNQCVKAKDLANCLSTIYINMVSIEEGEHKTNLKPSELIDTIMKEFDINFNQL